MQTVLMLIFMPLLCRTIYNMCTQKPPNDYSEPLYTKYREAFSTYISERVRDVDGPYAWLCKAGVTRAMCSSALCCMFWYHRVSGITNSCFRSTFLPVQSRALLGNVFIVAGPSSVERGTE